MTALEKALAELEEMPAQSSVTVVKGCTVRRTKHGQSIMRLHYSAIPERDPDTPEGAIWKKRERALYSSQAMWNKEQEIDHLAQGGEAVFGPILTDPELYQRIVISDPLWMPDPRWDVVGAFDHGKTNAACLTKAYITRDEIDPATGQTIPFEIIFAGEYYSMRRGPSPEEPEGWLNTVAQNVPQMLNMPGIDRMRWIVADPSIFPGEEAEAFGDNECVYREYKKVGMRAMRPYDGVRSDVTFVEWMLSDFWRGLAQGKRPRVRIVCRNPSDRPQPGLHDYDCPNLLWELRRARRVELTARQLMTKNQPDALVDKHNHARDTMKYLLGTVRKAAARPLHEEFNEKLEHLDPTTRSIFARHMFSEAVQRGEIDWATGKHKKSAPVISLRGRGGRRF